MKTDVKLNCNRDEENNLFFAEITYANDYTAGQGCGSTEEEAIIEACSNAYPFIKKRYNDKVLFDLCLNYRSSNFIFYIF